MSEEEKVSWMFWRDSFEFREVTLHGEAQTDELKRFVDSVRPYPVLLLALHQEWELLNHLSRRAVGKGLRTLAGLSAKG